jgi:hypothetical protein
MEKRTSSALRGSPAPFPNLGSSPMGGPRPGLVHAAEFSHFIVRTFPLTITPNSPKRSWRGMKMPSILDIADRSMPSFQTARQSAAVDCAGDSITGWNNFGAVGDWPSGTLSPQVGAREARWKRTPLGTPHPPSGHPLPASGAREARWKRTPLGTPVGRGVRPASARRGLWVETHRSALTCSRSVLAITVLG